MTDTGRPSMNPRVYIILVNWNGWRDSIECLESVLRLDYDNFRVLLCDNASTDGSLDQIAAWATGKAADAAPGDAPLAHLSTPPLPKPLAFARLDRAAAERGELSGDPPLVLIDTGANLGFAGGNNVGLRHALARGDADYVWLLNNDTVVDPDCLGAMLRRLQQADQPALCGSRILFYENPGVVQALGGGRFNRWTAICSQSLGRFLPAEQPIDPADYERQMTYIVGCSWLLPKAFLDEVGLMDERYFLYYEEVDWVLAAKGRYALCYADEARVYHKEGRSIGSPTGERPSSTLSDFYIFRNKLWITAKHFPLGLPTVYLFSLVQAMRRARRGQWDKCWLILAVLLGKRRFER
ncbi:glycosyltransferase family 2 protein [Rhabdochromatium marinum]|uniref:glycosyltransferase family 2 protein n=1 Tax=Rhabdochromatium marinum TaxID=48729 RepID=UPI0019076EF6|nr:glycosyltransferase family 2 protein [Rhabdochromatium marinum]